MSLEIYRRHTAGCKHANDRVSKECRCALWLTGTLFGKPYRRSAKTRSWKAARKIMEEIEDGENPRKEEPKTVSIRDGLDAFIMDCDSRNLNHSTLRKYRLLRVNLCRFCDASNTYALSECTADLIRQFRQARGLGPRTSGKELERIRAFFRFCVDNEWIAKNPAKAIKSPQVKVPPRVPFPEGNIEKILVRAEDGRELAFLLVLRYTGLRIGDASLLRNSQLSENRILPLHHEGRYTR